MMLILGLLLFFVCVFCHVYCEIRQKLSLHTFAKRDFSVFKFSGYNLKNMKKVLWKYSIQTLKTADSILLSLFMKDNGRCVFSHAT